MGNKGARKSRVPTKNTKSTRKTERTMLGNPIASQKVAKGHIGAGAKHFGGVVASTKRKQMGRQHLIGELNPKVIGHERISVDVGITYMIADLSLARVW